MADAIGELPNLGFPRGHTVFQVIGLRHVNSALTTSELQVARLAAEGATNCDIAQTLFLSKRTVEIHSYRKLAIASRTEIIRRWPPTAPVLNRPEGAGHGSRLFSRTARTGRANTPW